MSFMKNGVDRMAAPWRIGLKRKRSLWRRSMKPGSEQTVMPQASIEPSLLALLNRINGLAVAPMFRVQEDTGLSRALRPYLDYMKRGILSPLPEEIAQANLFLFADYFPEDGQLSLIEQVRETIDVHVPEDERA